VFSAASVSARPPAARLNSETRRSSASIRCRSER